MMKLARKNQLMPINVIVTRINYYQWCKINRSKRKHHILMITVTIIPNMSPSTIVRNIISRSMNLKRILKINAKVKRNVRSIWHNMLRNHLFSLSSLKIRNRKNVITMELKSMFSIIARKKKSWLDKVI